MSTQPAGVSIGARSKTLAPLFTIGPVRFRLPCFSFCSFLSSNALHAALRSLPRDLRATQGCQAAKSVPHFCDILHAFVDDYVLAMNCKKGYLDELKRLKFRIFEVIVSTFILQ